MSRYLATIGLTCVLVGVISSVARAGTTTFDPLNINTPWWDLEENWDFGTPDSGDHAVIPTGLTCVIREVGTYGIAEAKRVTVADGATLTLEDDSELWLGDGHADKTSVVDGLIVADNLSGSLVIASDHTITGDGGEIFLRKDSVIKNPLGEVHNLTLENDCIDPCDAAATCSLLVHGAGSFSAPITNNAVVMADHPVGNQSVQCPIILLDEPKDGCGIWGAEGQGQLLVNVEVSGSADWYIGEVGQWCAERPCPPNIHINEDCDQTSNEPRQGVARQDRVRDMWGG